MPYQLVTPGGLTGPGSSATYRLCFVLSIWLSWAVHLWSCHVSFFTRPCIYHGGEAYLAWRLQLWGVALRHWFTRCFGILVVLAVFWNFNQLSHFFSIVYVIISDAWWPRWPLLLGHHPYHYSDAYMFAMLHWSCLPLPQRAILKPHGHVNHLDIFEANAILEIILRSHWVDPSKNTYKSQSTQVINTKL